MAGGITVEIQNLPELRLSLKQAPKVTLKWLNKAVSASIFEIGKLATDDNFQFKTARAKRTGMLALSFKYGTIIKNLYGAIGPTVHYAPYVHFGTSRGIAPNPFMERIAAKATPLVNKHFKDAGEAIVDEIAKTSHK